MAGERPGAAGKPVTITSIVARGRTIQHGSRLVREGEEVELTADEHAQLLKAGFLHKRGEPETRPPSRSFVDVEGPVSVVTDER